MFPWAPIVSARWSSANSKIMLGFSIANNGSAGTQQARAALIRIENRRSIEGMANRNSIESYKVGGADSTDS